jgi:phytanoyl-CoA hydroxylase
VDSKPELTVPKTQSVNKIGHALCQLDPVFKKFTLENERIKDVARELGEHEDPLGMRNLRHRLISTEKLTRLWALVVLQSMIICKQPKIGAKVPIHTDSTFLYTHSATAIGFWIALEDVTETNGALSFLPGSHVDPRGGVGKRFVRMKNRAEGGEGGTGFINWDEENGKERAEGDAGKKEVDWEKEPGWELATCKAGSLVLIHGKSQLIC